MRNRPRRRWASALLNLLFLLAWGEPVSAHPCPMHDGAATASAVSHAGDGGDAAHGAHAAHGDAHGDARGDAQARPATPAHLPDGDASHSCQCLGECSTASAVALPGAVAVQWQAVVRHAAEPPRVGAAAPSAASPRLLPFANGPPLQA